MFHNQVFKVLLVLAISTSTASALSVGIKFLCEGRQSGEIMELEYFNDGLGVLTAPGFHPEEVQVLAFENNTEPGFVLFPRFRDCQTEFKYEDGGTIKGQDFLLDRGASASCSSIPSENFGCSLKRIHDDSTPLPFPFR